LVLFVTNNRTEAETWYHKGLVLWNELRDQHALWAKEKEMPKKVTEDLSRVRLANSERR
jgi:hypothetical protein